jgi:hypothetical protein
MGKKQQNTQKMQKRFCEALRLVRASEEKEARYEDVRSNRERFPGHSFLQLPFLYEVHKAALPGHNILRLSRPQPRPSSHLFPYIHGRSVLRGDGRQFGAIPYIPSAHIMIDHLHLHMCAAQRLMTFCCSAHEIERENNLHNRIWLGRA